MSHRRLRILLLVGPLVLAGCQGRAAAGRSAGMDPYAKDLIDSIAKLAGLVTVAAAALTLGLQFRRWEHDRQRAHDEQVRSLQEQVKARAQREEELRWRKASLAREALSELLGDPLAIDAMRMLDWATRHYTINGSVVTITREEMVKALRTTNLRFGDTESYIRDCFDSFFGHLQLIEHFLSIGLLEFNDVQYPASYYAGKLAGIGAPVEDFLRTYEYDMALRFLNRFPRWQERSSGSPRGAPVAS